MEAELGLEYVMRWLLLLLVWPLTGSAVAAPNMKKKRVTAASRAEDLRMWDGSVADVSWVNENTRPQHPSPTVSDRPWFSVSASAGTRLIPQTTPMIQQNETHQTIHEGLFTDLIDSKNSYEIRALFHPFSFLSIGGAYHIDDARLKLNQQSLPLAPEELSATMQIGPRLGPVRIYGFYSQLFISRSQASIKAATLVNDAASSQSFDVEVKQSGGEAGIGTQVQWGLFGFFAEGLRSVNRSYELSIAPEDQKPTFHATARPSFKAWQFGLSLNF